MKPFKTIRRMSGLVEGVCQHGVGHPLFGSADWMARTFKFNNSDNDLEENFNTWMTHGCCPENCCSDTEWQISTLEDSIKMANGLILAHKEVIQQMEETNESI